jgi:hypothetical protein
MKAMYIFFVACVLMCFAILAVTCGIMSIIEPQPLPITAGLASLVVVWNCTKVLNREFDL